MEKLQSILQHHKYNLDESRWQPSSYYRRNVTQISARSLKELQHPLQPVT